MSRSTDARFARSARRQLTLPRQSHTAEGPHDQTGMYVMHHAFRRDLDRFAGAVANTPVSEHEVWRALERRWLRMAELLHHHHTVEDEALWPVLRTHAAGTGAAEDLHLLEDMEAEHERIDPALVACREAFAAMSEHPCRDHRNALELRVAALRDGLLEHLAHEEGRALPMLQRTLSVEENEQFERAAQKGYPLRVVPFALCWVMDELPAEARDRILADTPPGYGLVLRLLRPRFEKAERRAFRYT
jgi:iron-sulfur cluster repair protein YtfE (RIC family)